MWETAPSLMTVLTTDDWCRIHFAGWRLQMHVPGLRSGRNLTELDVKGLEALVDQRFPAGRFLK